MVTNQFKKKFYGFIPSPPDERDHPASSHIPILGASAQDLDIILPRLEADYQTQNDCTCQVRATIKSQQELKERGKLERYDPNMLFCARQPGQYMGMDGQIGRETNENLQKFGISRRGLFNGRFNGEIQYIPDAVINNAYYQRVKNYFTINSIAEIKSALIYSGGFSVAIPLYADFFTMGMNLPTRPILPMPKPDEESKFGHDVAAQGLIAKNGNIVCFNSHGGQFGEGGYFELQPGYPIFERWGFTDEFAPPPNILTSDVVLTIGKKEYSVDGKMYSMDVAPFIDPISGRTMVPLRFIGEATGFLVQWNVETQEVYLTDGINWLKLTIGNNVWFDNGTIKVISNRSEFPRIVDNRTFIPLRLVMESLAFSRTIEWFADTQKIVLKA